MEYLLGGNNGPPDTDSGSGPICELGGRLLRDEPAIHSHGSAKRRPKREYGGACARQAARHTTGLIALLIKAMPIGILDQPDEHVGVARGSNLPRRHHRAAGRQGRASARLMPDTP